MRAIVRMVKGNGAPGFAGGLTAARADSLGGPFSLLIPYRHYAPVFGLGFWAGAEVPPVSLPLPPVSPPPCFVLV